MSSENVHQMCSTLAQKAAEMNPFLIDSYNFKSEQLKFSQVVKGLEETLNPADTIRGITSLEEKVMGAMSDVQDAVNIIVYFPLGRGVGVGCWLPNWKVRSLCYRSRFLQLKAHFDLELFSRSARSTRVFAPLWTQDAQLVASFRKQFGSKFFG